MDKKTEALKLALEALKIGYDYAVDETQRFHVEMAGYKPKRHEAMDADVRQIDDAITALRAALEEQPAEQQEPVAWRYNGKLHEFDPSDWATGPVTPLYTSPPAKPWVGLTDEETITQANKELFPGAFARGAIWAQLKLKEKNA